LYNVASEKINVDMLSGYYLTRHVMWSRRLELVKAGHSFANEKHIELTDALGQQAIFCQGILSSTLEGKEWVLVLKDLKCANPSTNKENKRLTISTHPIIDLLAGYTGHSLQIAVYSITAVFTTVIP
jgi:hypothetical protein